MGHKFTFYTQVDQVKYVIPALTWLQPGFWVFVFFKDTLIILKQSTISTDHWDKQYKCNIASNED